MYSLNVSQTVFSLSSFKLMRQLIVELRAKRNNFKLKSLSLNYRYKLYNRLAVHFATLVVAAWEVVTEAMRFVGTRARVEAEVKSKKPLSDCLKNIQAHKSSLSSSGDPQSMT